MAAKRVGLEAQPRRRGRRAAAPARRLTVSIIGAGRLGTALARALASRGYTIEALVARHKARARRAVKLSGTSALALTSTQLGQLPRSDLLLITTPDDAIATTSHRLAQSFQAQQSGRTVLHASGALSSDILQDLRGVGFATGSLHPLVSVSEAVHGAESLSRAFYCVEGDRAATRLARKVVRDLGAQSFTVRAVDKALYHAAAVMASGHAVALFDIAAEMLARCGLGEKRARAVLLPLLRSTMENLAQRTPSRALTGTFARADLGVMRRHLDAIRSRASTEALAAYVLLGRRSLRLAAENQTDAAALKEMARLLAEQ